jgi:hypothetical protein
MLLMRGKAMTANYFRSLAARCRTASHDCFELSAKEEFRQLATEFNAKAKELDYAADDFMMWGKRPQVIR